MRNNFRGVRVGGEIWSLMLSVLLVLFVTFVVFQINLYLVIGAVVFQLVYVLATQRQLVGNSLVVNSKQFEDIDGLVVENTEQLRIRKPKVYIAQDPFINAYTIGFVKPYAIVLTSSLVETYTRDELDFVLGHEMGHIKYGHSRILSLISPIGNDIPFISWLYGGWQRRSEYTADRIGLELTGKIRPALTAIIKMSVGSKLSKLVDIDEVVKQIGEGRRGFMAKVGEFMLTHPYSTNRIRAMVEYCYFSGICEIPKKG